MLQPVFVDADILGRRIPRQPWHRHYCAANYDDKFRACGEPDFTDRYIMTRWRAEQIRVGRETVLCFGHANRVVPIALHFEVRKLLANFLVGKNVVGTVDRACNSPYLFPQGQFVFVQRAELGLVAVDQVDDGLC